MSESLCPCQSEKAYAQCCQPYHRGQQYAPDAIALMRSRYSAYALGEVDYLLNTTHRDNPQYRKNVKAWRADVTDYCKAVQFLGLSILGSQALSENTATVTFKATLAQDGISSVLTEKSIFVKIGQRWLYHSGETELSN